MRADVRPSPPRFHRGALVSYPLTLLLCGLGNRVTDAPILYRHVFVCYLLVTWLACTIVCLANSIVPRLNIAGLVFILLGAIITIVVCVVMVNTGSEPASSETVWKNWSADIGYPDGFVFIAGMLNGAFAMGTPVFILISNFRHVLIPVQDATTHLAEEIPRPEINVPKAIAAQYFLGFISAFAYLVAILYSISDYDALYASSFPIAEVYSQATRGSKAATIILLLLLLIPTFLCAVGAYTTCGRTMWTLARVNATPFSRQLSHISERRHMPLAATLTSAVLVTILGTIYMGSTTAFNSFIASFILLTSASYIAALLPYLFRRSSPGFERGPFYMHGIVGWLVHGWACAYLMVWFVVYCFPYALPTDAQSMNYSVLIWGGLTVLAGIWWLIDGRRRCMWPARMGNF